MPPDRASQYVNVNVNVGPGRSWKLKGAWGRRHGRARAAICRSLGARAEWAGGIAHSALSGARLALALGGRGRRGKGGRRGRQVRGRRGVVGRGRRGVPLCALRRERRPPLCASARAARSFVRFVESGALLWRFGESEARSFGASSRAARSFVRFGAFVFGCEFDRSGAGGWGRRARSEGEGREEGEEGSKLSRVSQS